MTIKANNVEEYIEQVSEDKREAIIELRKIIKNNLSPLFQPQQYLQLHALVFYFIFTLFY